MVIVKSLFSAEFKGFKIVNYKAAATQGKYRWCHNKLSVLTGNQKQDRMKQPVRVAILFIKE